MTFNESGLAHDRKNRELILRNQLGYTMANAIVDSSEYL